MRSWARLGLVAGVLACTGTDPGPLLVDRDGDGILDVHEGEDDPDEDGLPNADDLDSDGDGLSDQIEAGDEHIETAPFDVDGDGLPNPIDLDSDGNGLPDAVESRPGGQEQDHDGDGVLDAHDLDDDDDGLVDTLEVDELGDFDHDVDGLPDRLDADSDADGLSDRAEHRAMATANDQDRDGDGRWNWVDTDSDGDGISDDLEGLVDTDGDGIADFLDRDSDNDGLTDAQEAGKTDPLSADTDGDGVRDGTEVHLGTDPADAADRTDLQVLTVPPRERRTASPSVELGQRQVDVSFVPDFSSGPQYYDTYFLQAAQAALSSDVDASVMFITPGTYNTPPWSGLGADRDIWTFRDPMRIDVWPTTRFEPETWAAEPAKGGSTPRWRPWPRS